MQKWKKMSEFLEQVAKPEPDDLCFFCNLSRVNHGDVNHEFVRQDEKEPRLRIKQPGQPARDIPPKHRDDVEGSKNSGNSRRIPSPGGPFGGSTGRYDVTYVAQSFTTLLEILIEKSYIDAKDLLRIFKGHG